MAINPDYLLNREPIVIRERLSPHKCILYALGVGADELDFVFEERLKPLPTLAAVLGYPGFLWRDPAMGADWQKILHGEQSTVIHRPLPTEGEVIGTTRIAKLFDKGAGKGAVALVERQVTNGEGLLLATVTMTTLLRGDGGFGGSDEGLPVPHALPQDRAPDMARELPTAANQALIYRLSGDLNPLHIDPAVAQAAGFERPILHGLATYGIAGRSLIAQLMENDPARLKRLDVRFSSPVYPGETIRTEVWHEEAGRASFRAFVVERNVMVLNNGLVEYS